MGGTGRPLGKTFFLQCQRRHPELPRIPTYLPRLSRSNQLSRGYRGGLSRGLSRDNLVIAGVIARVIACFFRFFCFFQATILQLPRIFVQDNAQAAEAAGRAAEAAGARPTKPTAARFELEGEKRLPQGASWRWGEPGDEACRMGGTGWYQQVTIIEKEGGVERKTNLTLPSYVWVWGETAKWPNAAEGETVAAFLCLFGMSDPPQRKS